MKKKYRRQLLATAVAYLYLLASSTAPQFLFAAASGNYTDLLPVGAAGNTTVISNGSGWSLTTLPPTQTFGDALSRVVTTVYQSTTTPTITNTILVSTFTASSVITGSVGSTTFPASWVASGRSIEVEVRGYYSTAASPAETWLWGVRLGTTTILNTTAITAPAGQTRAPFKANAVLSIMGTGTTGTVAGHFDVSASSGSIGSSVIYQSTYTSTTATVDLTTQLTVNPIFQWGSAVSSITVTNCRIKFAN